MWILKAVSSDKTVNIVPSKIHTFGRKGADFNIENDSSISRKHCTIEVADNGQGLLVKDSSKYGTFYAKNIDQTADISGLELNKVNGSIELSSSDILRIGVLKTVYRICNSKLLVLHSKLDKAARAELQSHVTGLGGAVVSAWSNSVTHLAMKEIVLNVKVTQALACNCPIVTCAFFGALAKAAQTGTKMPLCKDYVPDIADEGLNKNECSFVQDQRRVTLFSGKTFVFLSKKQFARLGETCVLAGAATLMVQDQKFNLQMLLDENTLVVSGVEAQDSVGDTMYGRMQEKMIEASSRFIQEFEIGLALLYCSVEMYCNPKFDLPPDGTFTSASLSQAHVYIRADASNKFTKDIPSTSANLVPETVDLTEVDDDIPQMKPIDKHPHGSRKRCMETDQDKAATSKMAKTISDEDGLLDLNQTKRKPKPAPKKKKTVETEGRPQNTIDWGSKPAQAQKEDPVHVVKESDSENDDLPDSCIVDDSLWTNTNLVAENNSKPVHTETHSYAEDTVKPGTGEVLQAPVTADTVTVVPPTPMDTVEHSVKIEAPENRQVPIVRPRPVSKTSGEGWVDSQSVHNVKSEFDDFDPELPFKDVTKINFVSLVVKQHKAKRQVSSAECSGLKNFKRFKKVFPLYYGSGSQTNTATSFQPPKIIGGNDLFKHDNRIENDHLIDDWAFPQSQEDSQSTQDSNPFRRLRT